jgi:D-glycero-alpha-D-manno-heptose-7-phosphate kinase
MLLFMPPDRHAAVREALNHLIYVPFKFEFSGSQIIFFDPEQDYNEAEQRRREQLIQAFRELKS